MVVAIAVWTGLALFSVMGIVVRARYTGRPIDLAEIAGFQLINWYSCAIFTPVYIWMANRWPFERAAWIRRLPIWLGVTLLIVPLKFIIEDAAIRLMTLEPRRDSLGEAIVFGFVPETIAFLSMIAVILSLAYYERWRMRWWMKFLDQYLAPSFSMIGWSIFVGPSVRARDPQELEAAIERIPLPERRVAWRKAGNASAGRPDSSRICPSSSRK